MSTGSPAWPGAPALSFSRWYDAAPSTLFRAFTDPGLLRRWWGPRGFVIEELEFPAVEGAGYRVCLRAPDGERYVHTGIFLRVAPPLELVYSWRWIEGPLQRDETLVELRFLSEASGTRVELRHSRFVDEGQREAHSGWPDSFDRLGPLLAELSAR